MEIIGYRYIAKLTYRETDLSRYGATEMSRYRYSKHACKQLSKRTDTEIPRYRDAVMSRHLRTVISRTYQDTDDTDKSIPWRRDTEIYCDPAAMPKYNNTGISQRYYHDSAIPRYYDGDDATDAAADHVYHHDHGSDNDGDGESEPRY